MNTKELIKLKAKELFSKKGIKNVTLREVAKSLNKSYGNVTYHYKNKEQLLEALFFDMNTELIQLQKKIPENLNLLDYFLILPNLSFDITIDYLFFYLDYVELQRNYPAFTKKVKEVNLMRKEKWLLLLIELQNKGFLKKNLTNSGLAYIMELSTGIRMLYFQETSFNDLNKREFSKKVNRLLFPYLTDRGKITYIKY